MAGSAHNRKACDAEEVDILLQLGWRLLHAYTLRDKETALGESDQWPFWGAKRSPSEVQQHATMPKLVREEET